VIEEIEKSGVKSLRIDTGGFIETLFIFCKGLQIWGDPNTKYTLITYEDTARYIAELVSQPDLSGHYRFSANELSPNEIAETYNKVRGTNIQPKVLGNIEDLNAKIKEYQAKGELLPSFRLSVIQAFADGRGRITKSDADKFPGVKPISFEQAIKENANLEF
jgi:nucleoside-diphosphate-sugar epimerase